MDFAKCEVCGRPRKGFVDLDVQWDLEYGVFLCKDCRKQVQETRKNLFGREFPDYNRIDKEEEPMKVKVRRDEKKEIEVDIYNLQYGDEFDISKDGEVIAVGTVVDVWTNKGVRRANVDLTFTKESKTWQDLGYDCFENMVDDIAKEHGSLGTRYKRCDCLDAADSYGESYVEIEQNGAKTIVHSDSVTVYPVRKEE